MKKIDLSNKVFGKLRVIEIDKFSIKKELKWICKCECGKFRSVYGTILRKGNASSCINCQNKKGRPVVDISGQVFGQLTVISISADITGKDRNWICLCTCGYAFTANGSAIRSKRYISCNDCKINKLKIRSTTHGHSSRNGHSPTYISWASMLTRATNPNIKQAKDYSERGITVCEEWKTFENFLKDMGERPNNTTLDRINNGGNYEPGNCRWADRVTQNNNTRRQNK